MALYFKNPYVWAGVVVTAGALAVVGYNYWGWFGGSNDWRKKHPTTPSVGTLDKDTCDHAFNSWQDYDKAGGVDGLSSSHWWTSVLKGCYEGGLLRTMPNVVVQPRFTPRPTPHPSPTPPPPPPPHPVLG